MKRNNSIELFPRFCCLDPHLCEQVIWATTKFFSFFFFVPNFSCIILSTGYICVRGIICYGLGCLSCNCLWEKLRFSPTRFRVEFGLTKTELNAKLWVLEAKITDMMQISLSLKHLCKFSPDVWVPPDFFPPRALGRTQSIVSTHSSTTTTFFSPQLFTCQCFPMCHSCQSYNRHFGICGHWFQLFLLCFASMPISDLYLICFLISSCTAYPTKG